MTSFKHLGEIVVSTVGALFILNSILVYIGEISAIIMIIIGFILIVMKKILVKLIPEWGVFDDELQDTLLGMVSGLFMATGLWRLLEPYALENIVIAFGIGLLLIIFKKQIISAIGGNR